MSFVHAPHEPGTSILDVDGLTFRYNGGVAVNNVTFRLNVGERVAVVGPNGAGKSTLFKVVAGLLDPSSGTVTVFGHRPVSHICIAYLPQRSLVDWHFPVTVGEAVMMGRVGSLGLLRRTRREDVELVSECLRQVGIESLRDRQIGELSGGQQQRMFIARALAMKAELMLMDEPFAGLDMHSQRAILEIIDQLAARRVTVVVALHDLNLARDHFDRVLLLNRDLVGFGRPDEVFTDANLVRAYGGYARAVPTASGALLVNDTCCGGEHDHAPRV